MFSKIFNLLNKNNNGINLPSYSFKQKEDSEYIITTSFNNQFRLKLSEQNSMAYFIVGESPYVFKFATPVDFKHSIQFIFDDLYNKVIFFHLTKTTSDFLAKENYHTFDNFWIFDDIELSKQYTMFEDNEYINLSFKSKNFKYNIKRFSFKSPVRDIRPVNIDKCVYYVIYGYFFKLSNLQDYIYEIDQGDLESQFPPSDDSHYYGVTDNVNNKIQSIIKFIDLSNYNILKFNDVYSKFKIENDHLLITSIMNLADIKSIVEHSGIHKLKSNTDYFSLEKNIHQNKFIFTKKTSKLERKSFGSYFCKFKFYDTKLIFEFYFIDNYNECMEKYQIEYFEKILNNIYKHAALRTSHYLTEELVKNRIIENGKSKITLEDVQVYDMINV